MQVIDKVSWVLIEKRKVLFVRTRGKDMFYFPGGKREGKETDSDALVREVAEELGVRLLPKTLTYLRTVSSQAHGQAEGVLVESKFYSGEYEGVLTTAAEIEEMAWFALEDRARRTETGNEIMEWLHADGLID